MTIWAVFRHCFRWTSLLVERASLTLDIGRPVLSLATPRSRPGNNRTWLWVMGQWIDMPWYRFLQRLVHSTYHAVCTRHSVHRSLESWFEKYVKQLTLWCMSSSSSLIISQS